jgi:hypothetical protein
MAMPENTTKAGFGRWTALGNAVHVGTAAWLANRITKVSASLPLLVPTTGA